DEMYFRGRVMDISQDEKMTLLLQQLGISSDYVDAYFQGSTLEGLHVYKEKKQWHFDIRIQQVLPIEVYEHLKQKFDEAFRQIAEVSFSLRAVNKECDEQTICDYWTLFLQSISDLSPAYKDLIHNQKPTVKNTELWFTARNDAEA